RLGLASTTGLTVSGNNSNGVTFTGTQTAINTALNGLDFNPNNSATGLYTLTITANDNGNTGLGGPLSSTPTVTIDMRKTGGRSPHLNLAPVNEFNGVSISPTPPSFATTVNTPLTFSGASSRRIASDDPDAGTSTNYTVTLSVTNGTLTLPST